MNMESENHLFEQEDHLNQTSILGRFKMSICQAGGNSGQEINAKTLRLFEVEIKHVC